MSADLRYGYRPQIGGLRALAISGVLLTHFWFPHLPLGNLGVRLFFVISGFLITERLLDGRALVEEGASTRGREGYRFFVRRALRLFPAFYLLLAVLLALDADGIRASAPWNIFNLTNFWFVRVDDWSPWMIAHFWSLSVEEQFYLLWPWLILFLPGRALAPAVAGTILAGVAFHLIVLATPLAAAQTPIWVLAPSALDALGAGGLLALAARAGRPLGIITALMWPAGALWLAVESSLRMGWLPDRLIFSYAAQDLIGTLAFTGLVARAHLDLAAPFALRPLVAAGRISYGIYLYHLPVLAALMTRLPDLDYGPRRFALATAATLVVATARWTLWESRFPRLKGRMGLYAA